MLHLHQSREPGSGLLSMHRLVLIIQDTHASPSSAMSPQDAPMVGLIGFILDSVGVSTGPDGMPEDQAFGVMSG